MFQEGDLVLEKKSYSQIEDKLSPNWVRPYRVRRVIEKRAYVLETLDGGKVPWTWNVANLHFYYN